MIGVYFRFHDLDQSSFNITIVHNITSVSFSDNHTTSTSPSPDQIVKTNQSKQEEIVPTSTPGDDKSQSIHSSSTTSSTEEEGETAAVQKRLKVDHHCDISSSQGMFYVSLDMKKI